MRTYTTVKEVHDALLRGVVVDQADNQVPARVIESLRYGRGREVRDEKGVAWGFSSHVRYEGRREIWWFDM
jgi:hypothetical protein